MGLLLLLVLLLLVLLLLLPVATAANDVTAAKTVLQIRGWCTWLQVNIAEFSGNPSSRPLQIWSPVLREAEPEDGPRGSQPGPCMPSKAASSCRMSQPGREGSEAWITRPELWQHSRRWPTLQSEQENTRKVEPAVMYSAVQRQGLLSLIQARAEPEMLCAHSFSPCSAAVL